MRTPEAEYRAARRAYERAMARLRAAKAALPPPPAKPNLKQRDARIIELAQTMAPRAIAEEMGVSLGIVRDTLRWEAARRWGESLPAIPSINK
jgi:hypothetical protein